MTTTSPKDIAALFPSGQIRLAELSVYNWGSFHGLHTVAVDPDGTLITGDNGSGKSTLVDALMALLQPAGRAAFNIAAAQGERNDRTLMSYIRGNFGSAHAGVETRAQAKREGATASAVRACYRAEDDTVITLAAMFWIAQASNAMADLRRHYVVAQRDLGLTELLQVFANGNVRALRQHLRDDTRVHSCDERFSEYQEKFRRLLRMDNRNAPALLSRALGLKKVDDLTELIRSLVLEPSSVREDAQLAVAEFDDLRAIHEQLVDAQRQHDALANLPDAHRRWRAAGRQVSTLGEQLEALPVYLARQARVLWERRVARLEISHREQETALAQVKARLSGAEEEAEARHADYLSQGGERIESLRREQEHAQHRLGEINARATRYQAAARSLGVDPTLSHPSFEANQAKARQWIQGAQALRAEIQDAFGEAAGELSQRERQLSERESELREVAARPDSNIDPRYQRLRDHMVKEIGIPSALLRFIGELVDVAPEHHAWQGAIERALGGLRTTLLVQEKELSKVTAWLNTHHTGLYVRAQTVKPVRGTARFRAAGYLRKLQWCEHPYREWLKHHLARLDLECVNDTETLDRTPFSLTREGLIHREAGRFEKRDTERIDDRRSWALGFSNETRVALLRSDCEQLRQAVAEARAQVEARREAVDDLGQTMSDWERLREYPWPEIDAPAQQARVEQLRNDVAELEARAVSAAQARERWESAKQVRDRTAEEHERAQRDEWQAEQMLDGARTSHQRALESARPALSQPASEQLRQFLPEFGEEDLDRFADIEAQCRQDLARRRDRAGRQQQESGQRCVGIISQFRGQWTVIAGEWAADLDAVGHYLDHFETLVAEGLPALVDEFKQRLNRHTTQSLAGMRAKIDAERDAIRERIDVINRVLERTEFRAGTYLRLQSRREQFPHVTHFHAELRRVFEQASAQEDAEQRFLTLQQVIAILEKASNPGSAHTLESLRLLDPRYQMAFYAEELNRADDSIRDVLTSSSGKSGGEKEAFAGTIVAASLAYVLTPEGSDRPIYATVFLDEAFSNTAEAVSRRVLQVFRELHLHVNLITPYKNLNLARESARSLIIVERDLERHESQLCEVTWEEIDRRLAEQHAEVMTSQVQALGIEVQAHS